jgi:hypothetical protein
VIYGQRDRDTRARWRFQGTVGRRRSSHFLDDPLKPKRTVIQKLDVPHQVASYDCLAQRKKFSLDGSEF